MTSSLLLLASCAAAIPVSQDFLNAHDPIWEAAPQRWLTGIPLANGDIGALIWGDGSPLKITLDKYDAWETREVPLDLTYQQLRKMVQEEKKTEAE